MSKPAPDSFKVRFETSKGIFTMVAYRAWAPNGVDRFHYLVANNYFDGVHFFRVLPNFVVQFGIHGDPQISAAWQNLRIAPDSVKQSNQLGFVTYAMGTQPDTRTTQLFINTRDNNRLDAMGFAPIGKVTEGMEVVGQFFAGYGEGGRGGPDQGMIQQQGNAYLNRQFAQLDSIVRARIIQ